MFISRYMLLFLTSNRYTVQAWMNENSPNDDKKFALSCMEKYEKLK